MVNSAYFETSQKLLSLLCTALKNADADPLREFPRLWRDIETIPEAS
jgi:hypothetical protein